MDKKQEEIKIKKLTIKIGKTEVSVSVEQARELHRVLGDMFKEKIVEHYHQDWWLKYYRPQPYVYETGPYTSASPLIYSSNVGTSHQLMIKVE